MIDPRKTPRQQRAIATVEAILEAAARILETHGLDALTTNAVAERAGVSIGSLYQYFPGKEALLAALIRRERALLKAAVDAALAAPGLGFEARVSALIAAAAAHQIDRAALARALDFVEPLLPLDAETAALTAAMVEAIAALLTAHAVPHPEEAARDLVALTHGMVDAAGLAGETDAAALTARVTRAALGYLGPTSPIATDA